MSDVDGSDRQSQPASTALPRASVVEEQLHELALIATSAGMFEAAAFLYDRLSRGDTHAPKRRMHRER